MKIYKRFTLEEKKFLILYNDYIRMVSEAKYQSIHGEVLKILTPKQMLQRLALAQVKSGNTSEKLLNETCQIVYSLYRTKEITKKLYNKIIYSIRL